MTMTKQYILFDLDGTLTDPMEGITKSLQYALQSFGITVKNREELKPFIGPPLRDTFRKCGIAERDIEPVVAKYREYFGVTGLFENTLYDGIDGLLSGLHDSGKTLILATSKAAVYAERILEHFDIAKYFRFVSGCEMDGRRSKKSEVIGYALLQCGIADARQAVMIGDREHDIIGAKECGMDSVGVLYGYGSREELTRAGVDRIVKDVAELTALLRA